MSTIKNCVKLTRQDAYSTADFLEVFGAKLKSLNKVESANKDQLIITMANTIMDLAARGKFNLRDL